MNRLRWEIYSIEKVGKKVVLCILFFMTGVVFVVTNASGWHVIVGFGFSTIALISFFRITNVFYIGYLETLNTDLESAVESIKELFTSAAKSIKIVSGYFPQKKVYFQPEVFTALKEAIERGVSIKIILGEPDVTIERLKEEGSSEIDLFLSWVKYGQVSLKKATRKRIQPHFILIDGLHVRIENKHPSRQPEETRKSRAVVYYLSPRAQRYQVKFNRLQGKVGPLTF